MRNIDVYSEEHKNFYGFKIGDLIKFTIPSIFGDKVLHILNLEYDENSGKVTFECERSAGDKKIHYYGLWSLLDAVKVGFKEVDYDISEKLLNKNIYQYTLFKN